MVDSVRLLNKVLVRMITAGDMLGGFIQGVSLTPWFIYLDSVAVFV